MKQIGPFIIRYDRLELGWLAQSGDQKQVFSTGARGEREAVRHAIRQAVPEVAMATDHLCTHYPEAASRGWAAAELLVLGSVLTPDPTESGELALAVLPLANQLLCKHLLAYWLATHLGWPMTVEMPAPLHPRRSHGGRFRGRAVTAVGQNNLHQLVPSQAAVQYGNGQPVLPAHQTDYKSFVAFTQQRPFSQEKLLSWSLGR